MRILVVLTSHDRLGASARRTGVELESFALGYYAFVDAGLDVAICSPLGGPAPIAPSVDRASASHIVQRFYDDPTAREEFSDGLMLSQVCAADFSAVYYPDGAGAVWDLAHDGHSQALIWQMQEMQRPCALVGYGTAALLEVRGPDNVPLVSGRRLTAPDLAANAAIGLPEGTLLLAQELAARGAVCVSNADAAPFMVQAGTLITGRNLEASALVAQATVAAAI